MQGFDGVTETAFFVRRVPYPLPLLPSDSCPWQIALLTRRRSPGRRPPFLCPRCLAVSVLPSRPGHHALCPHTALAPLAPRLLVCVAGMGRPIGGLYLAGLTTRAPSQNLMAPRALPPGVYTATLPTVATASVGDTSAQSSVLTGPTPRSSSTGGAGGGGGGAARPVGKKVRSPGLDSDRDSDASGFDSVFSGGRSVLFPALHRRPWCCPPSSAGWSGMATISSCPVIALLQDLRPIPAPLALAPPCRPSTPGVDQPWAPLQAPVTPWTTVDRLERRAPTHSTRGPPGKWLAA